RGTASNVAAQTCPPRRSSDPPQAPPAAPSGLTATPSNAQVALSWTGVTGAATYSVYRGTSTGAETLLVSGRTTTTYSDTSVTNGTTYFYEVTASNVRGESGTS